MEFLTNEEYEARGAHTKVAPHTFSWLTPAELKEVRDAVALAFPHWSRKDRVVTLACQPTQAALFVSRVNNHYYPLGEVDEKAEAVNDERAMSRMRLEK